MRLAAAILVPLFLAGCATQAERAAAVERDIDDMVRVYGPGCEKLGYKASSDPWCYCVLRLATNDRLERRDFTTTNCIASRGIFHCSSF